MVIERCHLSQFERFTPDVSYQHVVAELASFPLDVEMRLKSLVVDLPGCPELDVRGVEVDKHRVPLLSPQSGEARHHPPLTCQIFHTKSYNIKHKISR